MVLFMFRGKDEFKSNTVKVGFLSRTALYSSHKEIKSGKAQYFGLLFISGSVHQTQFRNMKYVSFFIVHFWFTGGDCH